jgi:hypothetical protein
MAEIKETTEVLAFLGEVYRNAKDRGKRRPRILKLASKGWKAFEGIAKVGEELDDISPEEMRDIVDFLREEFALPETECVALAGEVAEWLRQGWQIAKRFRGEPTTEPVA